MDQLPDKLGAEQDILHERALQLAKVQELAHQVEQAKLLILRLGDEWYAADVTQVREVLHGLEITRVPCTPSYVLGIVSVRGEIISVCDVKEALGLSMEATLGRPPIVVVEMGDLTTGLAADDVSDIVEIPETSVEPPLTALDRYGAEYITGEAMIEGRLVAILDVERLVTLEGQ